MWNFLESINNLYLVNRVNRWREAAVNAKDGVVNDNRECEEVKHVGKI